MSNPDQHWSEWAPYPKDAGWRLRLPVSTERSVNCPRRQTSTFARPAGIGTSVMRTTSLSRAKTWHERSTGIAYRRVPGNPFLGDSRTSTVNCFLVVDGEFLFLRRENSDRTSHSVMGEVGRVEA